MLDNPQETKRRLVEWIKDYFRQNGPECTAVIGISGGKDSSICAALCLEALGPERVLGVLMPNGEQPDIEDSRSLVKVLGLKAIEINIEQGYRGMLAALGGKERLGKDALINLPPRLRMATLYAIAQSLPKGGRVVNTCNRSEDYIGYSTKFGDAAGDFSPLSNLLVSEVRQIGKCTNVPLILVEKTPSDGLCGQTDEEKIGFTYETLDRYILTGEAPAETKAKIDRMHERNLHKLLPMPSFDPNENA